MVENRFLHVENFAGRKHIIILFSTSHRANIVLLLTDTGKSRRRLL